MYSFNINLSLINNNAIEELPNDFDIISELNLTSNNNNGTNSDLYCDETLFEHESIFASDVINISDSDSEMENAFDVVAELNLQHSQDEEALLVISTLNGMKKPWTGKDFDEKSEEAIDLEIFTRHYLESLWRQFFVNINPGISPYRCWFPQKLPRGSNSLIKGYWIINPSLEAFEDRKPDQEPFLFRSSVRIGMTHVSKWLHHHIHIHQMDHSTNQYIYYPGVPRCALDASHLCHNTECLNPNHIIFEPHEINLNRNECKGTNRFNKKLGKNVHHCSSDHFLGDPYNIKLPDCLPFSDVFSMDGKHHRRPRNYTQDRLQPYITYWSQIRPPCWHKRTSPLTEQEKSARTEERRPKKRIKDRLRVREKVVAKLNNNFSNNININNCWFKPILNSYKSFCNSWANPTPSF